MSIDGLITLAITLVIIGVIAWGVWYLTTALPVPDPLGKIIRVIVMVVCVCAAILVLLRFVGVGLAM